MDSAPSAPVQPNAAATASAQSTANAGTATAQTALNNANQVTPYGTMTYAQTGSQTIDNPDGTTTSVPTYTSTQTLSPVEQTLFDQQNALGIRENNVAGAALTSAGSILRNPVSESSLPSLTTSLGATPSLATGYDQGGAIQTSVPVQMASTTFAGSDPSSFTADRDAATNAALARLQPQMDRDNASLQAQLANQGVTAGSSAYTGAMQGQAQANNDLRLGAVQTGDAEQQALYGEALNSANYGLSATSANNAANLAAGAFANSAQAQQNGENAAAAAFGNSAKQQQFGDTQAAATFANQAREQSLSDQIQMGQAPINEISALMHGGQASTGSYQGYSAGQIGETPISQDTYQTAGLNQQTYNTQTQSAAANNSAMMQGLTGLFGMGGNYLAGRTITAGR